MVIIETERLTLSKLELVDAPFIFELYNDPDFIKYIGDRGIRSLSDAKQFIETGPQASYSEHGHGLYLVQLNDGTPIGICGLLKRDTLDDPDIGFAMLPKFRNNGYTYEAALAAMNNGRNIFGYQRIVAITSPANEASNQLLIKMGLSDEGIVQLTKDGEACMLFSIDYK